MKEGVTIMKKPRNPLDRIDFRKVLIISLIPMALEILWSIYNAYVPLYLQGGHPAFASSDVVGFGLSPAITGVIMTIDNIAALVLVPILALLSDFSTSKYGRRRPFLSVGSWLTGICMIALILVYNSVPAELSGHTKELSGKLALFLASILFIVIAWSGIQATNYAFRWDTFESRKRSKVQGTIVTLCSIAAAIGLFATAPLYKLNTLYPYVMIGVLMIAAGSLVWLIPEKPVVHEELVTLKAQGKKPGLGYVLSGLTKLPKASRRSIFNIIFMLIFACIAMSIVTAFSTSFAIFVLGMEASTVITVVLAGFIGGLIGAIPSGYLAAKFGRKTISRISLAAVSATSIGFFFCNNTTLFLVLMFVNGALWMGANINMPLILIDSNVDETKLGTFTGLSQMCLSIGNIVGPALGGLLVGLMNNNYRTIYLIMPVAFLAALAFTLGITTGEAKKEVGPDNEVTA